ncbi:hypothetical protein LPJ59_002565 [Coemansia sp. RSA 2399]|nr:hypothetical protein LPJ59_002565 [Coemansia sp. RSA 2399]
MVTFAPAILALVSISSIVAAEQCNGNVSKCPNNIDGVSPTYLQCNSWTHQYDSASCPAGLVCFANPKSPGNAMCGLPGSGGVPGEGSCTGNTAKCVANGTSGDYYQCNQWSGQYVNAKCPTGLNCHNNASNTGVFCQ